MTNKNLVYPNALALSFLHDHGPFRLKFGTESRSLLNWCDVYKGRKKVWSCNAIFAKANFYPCVP